MDAQYSVSFANQEEGELGIRIEKCWKEVRDTDGEVLGYMRGKVGQLKILLTDEGTLEFEFCNPADELVNSGTIASVV